MTLVRRGISRKMTLLVVDPDQGHRRGMLETLAKEAVDGELEFLTADSVEQAMALFRERHPDLLLISTAQLDQLGLELAMRVRAAEGTRHTGIVFVDHRPKDDGTLSVECLEMGADDFLRQGATAAEVMARLRAVLRLKAMTDELRSANHRLSVLSLTDELTGLANMRHFNQGFAESVRKCRRDRVSLGVIMIDLDHFKSVNDTTNHLIGSHMLVQVGQLIRQCPALGKGALAARYGGDEFVIVCEAGSVTEIKAKAEALRQAIARATFERDGCQLRITASLGCAFVPKGFRGRAEDIVKVADLMLYKSKNDGRNRVSALPMKYPMDLQGGIVQRFGKLGVTEDENDDLSLPFVKGG